MDKVGIHVEIILKAHQEFAEQIFCFLHWPLEKNDYGIEDRHWPYSILQQYGNIQAISTMLK